MGDCDVYVRHSALPTTAVYQYASVNPGNDESVAVTDPAEGSWYIMLYPASPYLSLTLEVSYSGSSNTNVSIGNEIWDFTLDGSVHSVACVAADGTIYTGTSGPNGSGYFYALNADGTLKWRQLVGDVSASPALGGDGTIYVVLEAGQLQALDPSGSVKWTLARGTDGLHSVAVAKNGHRLRSIVGEQPSGRQSGRHGEVGVGG